VVLKNGEAFVSGMGTEASFGNGRRQVQAVVDELNANGGIAGRKVEPFYGEYDAAAADQEASYASACAKLTQDDQVFAILTPINVRESVVACAAKARTPLINASFNPGDDYLYRKFGDYFFSPSMLNLDNSVRLMLTTLRGQGALSGDVKVGMLYVGDPQYERVVQGAFVPTLEAWGVPYETAATAQYNAAQINGAQLRFAAEGVNLVMFVAPNGINQVLFMQQAEQQGYRPRYFMTDSDSTRFASQNVPQAQARNIQGVGTLPISNVPAQQYPSNPREQACLEIMRERSGENTTNRLTSLTATLYCELLWEFAAVTEQVRGSLTVDSWRAAYPTVGRSYRPVSTFGMDLSSGRHDNATLYRPFGWRGGCSCLTYTGKERQIPR
jgi:ABC-type branched-subunit amino acid transport system substrate-binding protein